MRPIIKALTISVVGALIILTGGSAVAAPAERSITNLRHIAMGSTFFYNNTTGSEINNDGFVKWSRFGVDSPNDRGDWALHSKVPAGNADGNYFNLFASDASRSQNRLVSHEKNLSFDIRSDSSDGGGAPRISVEFLNGDVAYLASQFCKRTLTNDSSWASSDFTGAKHNCEFNVTGDTGGIYAADGARSAWQVYADANPTQRVSDVYMVFDNVGNYWVDRVSLGTAWQYTSYFNKGVQCLGDETRC